MGRIVATLAVIALLFSVGSAWADDKSEANKRLNAFLCRGAGETVLPKGGAAIIEELAIYRTLSCSHLHSA